MLQPWQLIKLKAKYGGVYVAKHKGKLYVQRQPTLLEVTQQKDQQRVFSLDSEQMFIELAKACLVYPEDVDDVPEEQIHKLAEQILDDVPLSETEIEHMLAKYQDIKDNLYKQVAIELWQKITGTTVHEFYNRPISEVLEMYQAQKMIEKAMEEEYAKIQKQPNVQQQQPGIPIGLYNQQQHVNYPGVQFGSGTIQLGQGQIENDMVEFTNEIIGKDIKDVLKDVFGAGGI